MILRVNGDSLEMAESSTVTSLVNQLGYQDKRIAIEVNEKIIPKSSHNQYKLLQDDKVEIIVAVGGG
ncbi:MAG TPA: sulfur carrier protein ThiS [Candidatus Thioglobus sp.]|jgi:sulfur carrier protein|nr:sulfur carrier protein ThiS [Candidatus Thioglobus sp.]HIL41964.1 sulfur carrier protein ThiS [Gammaproteobacteria bacterium]